MTNADNGIAIDLSETVFCDVLGRAAIPMLRLDDQPLAGRPGHRLQRQWRGARTQELNITEPRTDK